MQIEPHGRHYPSRPALDVKIHLLKCAIKNVNHSFQHAQFLGLIGQPGTGKTSLAQDISNSMGASVHMIHGSALGGPYEGMASDVLAEAYLTAAYDESAFISVLIIDDIETGDANSDHNIAGTSSRHLIVGMLMEMANNPFVLRRGVVGRAMQHIHLEKAPAVLFTSNGLDVLSEAMLRTGRAWFSEVNPKGPELEAIVASIYPACSADEVKELVAAFPDETTSFFAELGHDVSQRLVEQVIMDFERPFSEICFESLGREIEAAKQSAGFNALMEAATRLAGVDRSRSFSKSAA